MSTSWEERIASEYGTAEEHTKALLAEMKQRGIARMEIAYSGGNDEGGVQEIELFDSKGGKIPFEIAAGSHTREHPLWSIADALLSTKFYTWAGEWSAYGTLYVDGKEKRAWTEGTMTVDASDENPIEVQL